MAKLEHHMTVSFDEELIDHGTRRYLKLHKKINGVAMGMATQYALVVQERILANLSMAQLKRVRQLATKHIKLKGGK